MGPSEEALVLARTMLDRAGVSRGANPSLEVELAYHLMARAEAWIDSRTHTLPRTDGDD
jgi:hypothetical protein